MNCNHHFSKIRCAHYYHINDIITKRHFARKDAKNAYAPETPNLEKAYELYRMLERSKSAFRFFVDNLNLD